MRKPWPESAAEAFTRVDWKRLMPALLRAARGSLRSLGWSETRGERPGVMEAQELVNAAIESLLSGQRGWVPGTAATDGGFVGFMHATMRSIAVNHRTSAEVSSPRAGDEELENEADDGPTPERQLAARALLARVEEALEGDDEAMTVYRAMAEGATTPADLTEALGWPLAQVTVVRRRITRRLEAKQIAPGHPRAPRGGGSLAGAAGAPHAEPRARSRAVGDPNDDDDETTEDES